MATYNIGPCDCCEAVGTCGGCDGSDIQIDIPASSGGNASLGDCCLEWFGASQSVVFADCDSTSPNICVLSPAVLDLDMALACVADQLELKYNGTVKYRGPVPVMSTGASTTLTLVGTATPGFCNVGGGPGVSLPGSVTATVL